MAEITKNKEIRYLGRDFSTLRQNLMDFAKVYYPTTYRNFNEASVGQMFIEMASYVGDVLSYYIDSALKESLLYYAEENQNIYAIAQSLGYRPSLSYPALVTLDVYQIVPAAGTGGSSAPDYRYALIVNSGMQVSSEDDNTVIFRTVEDINFAYSSSENPTSAAVYEVDGSGNPTFFVLKKSVDAAAGEIKETELSFTDPVEFAKRTIADDNIIEILYGTDSDGNKWYHVPYLAQDTVFTDIQNIAANETDLAQYGNETPYLLKLQKSARRFTSRILSDKKVEVQFGSGVSDNPDELIIPNPTNIGSNVFGSVEFSDNPIDPANFLHTRTYGQSPHNTTITIKYVAGGGLKSNVNQNSLTKVKDVVFSIDDDALNASVLSQVESSLAVNNPIAAVGGRDGDTVEEVRYNALAEFPTQLRMVNKEDFISRVYSMPAKYGSIAKAYVVQDDQLSLSPDTSGFGSGNSRVANPLAINLYVLGYNNAKTLTTANKAVKTNLKTYLSQYRMLTDAINIKDGFIVNIAVLFDIVVFKNYNKREVLLNCVQKMKDFFNLDKWQFNQPIIISDIHTELFSVEGVQAVTNIQIENRYKTSDGYSGNFYDMKSATKDNIIYPSLDPSIFCIKFTNSDIIGRAL